MELYTAGTGNGQRAAIAVNECGVSCKMHVLNLGQGDQKAADYLKINPTARIPALIDPEGPGGKPLTVTQSWAILMYLCEKTGKYALLVKPRLRQGPPWISHWKQRTGPRWMPARPRGRLKSGRADKVFALGQPTSPEYRGKRKAPPSPAGLSLCNALSVSETSQRWPRR
jgi:glutathione S-transferase